MIRFNVKNKPVEMINADSNPANMSVKKAKLVGSPNAVLFVEQALEEEQKKQARENIGAIGEEDLPEAINDALAQAKESGEFDGEDGYTPEKGKDYWTPNDRQEIIDDVLDEVLNEIPEAPKQTATFYTELSRYRGDSEKMVCVNCHGLTAGEKYGIHLYASARRRGTSQDPWRHPSNENTGEGYTGKGYANLVGLKYGNDPRLTYPDVPSWMPRGGILQTEWTFTAKKATEKFEINIGAWLVPLLKPIQADFNLDEYALIGVSAKAIAPLLFQFRLVKDGTVGDCRNTLCVGLAKEKNNGVWAPGIIRHVAAKDPEINTSYLYTSIR